MIDLEAITYGFEIIGGLLAIVVIGGWMGLVAVKLWKL